MPKSIGPTPVTDSVIINKIFLIRKKKVMLDRDLAELYNVDTKQLKRQVRRNMQRFPADFMFQLNEKEFKNWRSQIGTSNSADKMGLRYAPYAFTEQGVAMLSSILNSQTAISVNIRIIRIFTKLREVLLTQKNILIKLENLEKRLIKQDHRTRKNEDDIKQIISVVKGLLAPPVVPRPKVGFRRSNDREE